MFLGLVIYIHLMTQYNDVHGQLKKNNINVWKGNANEKEMKRKRK